MFDAGPARQDWIVCACAMTDWGWAPIRRQWRSMHCVSQSGWAGGRLVPWKGYYLRRRGSVLGAMGPLHRLMLTPSSKRLVYFRGSFIIRLHLCVVRACVCRVRRLDRIFRGLFSFHQSLFLVYFAWKSVDFQKTAHLPPCKKITKKKGVKPSS